MGSHHLADFPLVVQDAHLGGVAVGHVADGVGHRGPQRVRLSQVFAIELLTVQGVQTAGGPHGLLQILAGPADRLAGEQRLAGAGGGAGVRRAVGVGPLVDDPVPGNARLLVDHLCQHRAQALADAGGTGKDVEPAVLHHQAAPAGVRDAHAHAGVLHGASQAHVLVILHIGLHRLQRLHQAGGVVYDLAVGQLLSRANGVAVADLPGGKAHDVRHLV